MRATPRPVPVVAVLPLLLAAVLLASCSGEPPAPGPSPSPTPERIPTGAPETPLDRPTPAPDPLVAGPPEGGVGVPADRVDTAGVPVGFPTLVWTRGESTLGVYGRAGGCTEARARIVGQDGERVEVLVSQVRVAPDPCTRELLYPAIEVPLAEPLGDRRVVLRGEER